MTKPFVLRLIAIAIAGTFAGSLYAGTDGSGNVIDGHEHGGPH